MLVGALLVESLNDAELAVVVTASDKETAFFVDDQRVVHATRDGCYLDWPTLVLERYLLREVIVLDLRALLHPPLFDKAAAVLVVAPSEEPARTGDGGRVELPGRDLSDLAAEHIDIFGLAAIGPRPDAELAVEVEAPCEE